MMHPFLVLVAGGVDDAGLETEAYEVELIRSFQAPQEYW
jgi:hypothetical protein